MTSYEPSIETVRIFSMMCHSSMCDRSQESFAAVLLFGPVLLHALFANPAASQMFSPCSRFWDQIFWVMWICGFVPREGASNGLEMIEMEGREGEKK